MHHFRQNGFQFCQKNQPVFLNLTYEHNYHPLELKNFQISIKTCHTSRHTFDTFGQKIWGNFLVIYEVVKYVVVPHNNTSCLCDKFLKFLFSAINSSSILYKNSSSTDRNIFAPTRPSKKPNYDRSNHIEPSTYQLCQSLQISRFYKTINFLT